MTRRGMNEAQQRGQVIQDGQRIIAQGERPFYRVRMTQDGRWEVDACPWLLLDAASLGVEREHPPLSTPTSTASG